MNFRRKVFTWVFIFALLILAYLYIVLELINPVLQQNTNTLAIGQLSIIDSLSIPIVEPQEFDYKSQDEIFAIREQAALQYAWLLYTSYEPSYEVFSGIEDSIPWWGLQGQYYDGPGEQSILGPSEEARYLLNPYLLIGVDFSGLSIWSGRAEAFWNQGLITSAALESVNFPYYVVPQKLQWSPGRSRVEATYDLSQHLIRLNNWTARKLTFRDASFDLIAYNARDLNMNYIYVDYAESIYISKEPYPKNAIEIKQYLHKGDSCGYPGGCNNMSPDVPELQDIYIGKLPAKAIIYLWQDKPAAVTDLADITYVINIK